MTQAANAQDLIGRVVGGLYRVDKKLGEGGMGTVYKALDVKLERPVALKVIRPDLGSSPDFAARFLREAKAAARFKHPNSVDVYMIGEDKDESLSRQGLLFMALEFIEGRELREVIRERGSLAAPRAISIATQILAALQKAHEQGIVHRDLKPQNVMVTTEDDQDAVKILDFGIAKMKDVGAGALKTQAGTIMGTVAYMSPEQARGEEVDGRSDLYAVGIILYQMVTGDVPFQAKSSMELLKKQIEQLPPPPRSKRSDLPEALEKVILKSLEKKREDRYQDARSFAHALEASRGSVEPTVIGLQVTGATFGDRPTQAPGLATIAETKGDGHPASHGQSDPKAATRIAYEQGGTAQIYAGLVGRTIDEKYDVLAKLGEGGMGAVFKARHTLLDKFVALKVVHPALGDRPDVRERFLREAKAAMEFVHPNAVPVRDFGHTRDGLLFMTQDFSPGQSLRKILDTEKRLEAPRSLAIVRQVLLALGEAHNAGIVHRDVKPENILVEKDEASGDEIVRVCDFGIAKLADAKAVGKDGESLTGAQVIGTPHYMSPEQASGEKIDGRADLYAVGCVLYELLSGRKVFEAESVMQVLMKQVTVAPEPLSKRVQGLPAGLEPLAMRLLSKEPAARFQTAEETVEAIDALGITLPGRILGRTRNGKKTAHTKPALQEPASSRALARGVFAVFLITVLTWGGLAVFYSPAVDAGVPAPLRRITRLLARYTPPPPGPTPDEQRATDEAKQKELDQQRADATARQKELDAQAAAAKQRELDQQRADADKARADADARAKADADKANDEAAKAKAADEARQRELEQQQKADAREKDLEAKVAALEADRKKALDEAAAEKKRAEEEEARRRQDDAQQADLLAKAKREAEDAKAALAEQKKQADDAVARLVAQQRAAEDAADRLAQQQRETQDEEKKLALAREEAAKRDEAARNSASLEDARRKADEAARRQEASQGNVTPPTNPRLPPVEPQPDTTPLARPQPTHPVNLPAPSDKRLTYGSRTCVAVAEGGGFFWMQEKSVTVREYLAFVDAVHFGRTKLPAGQWKNFLPDAGTKLGKDVREQIEIDPPVGRTTHPLARMTDPPAELGDRPVDGITVSHAKAFAAWAGGGARLPSATEVSLAGQTKALAELAAADGVWGDAGPVRKNAARAAPGDPALEGVSLRLCFSR